MQKQELVENISRTTGIEKVAVKVVVDCAMEEIKNALADNKSVYMRGFGTFEPKVRKEKKARIISKGETIVVPEHRIPFFKAGKEFKAMLK